MLIIRILKINKGLAPYNYYLDVADYLIKEANQQLKDNERLWTIEKKINCIEVHIDIATDIYKAEDPSEKTHEKMLGFISKKKTIKARLDQLKVVFEKKIGQQSVG
jgi:hypothetical protein